MKSGVIQSSLGSLRRLLPPAQKRYGVWMLFLLLVNSFLDVFGLAALVPIIMLASEPGAVAKNKYFAPLYHSFNFGSERHFIALLVVAVFAFFLFKNVFSTWANYLQTRFTANIGLYLINRQLTKYLNFPFWYFNDLGSATISNSSMSIPGNYVSGIVRPMLNLLSETAVIVIIVVGIVLYNPLLLLLLAIVLVPTVLLTYRALRNRSLVIGTRINYLRPIAYSNMLDMFIGFTELKLADKLGRFRLRVTEGQKEMQELDAEGYLYGQLPIKIIEMVAILGVCTILLYALYFVHSSAGLVGLVGLFAAAAYRLMPSVNRMLTSTMQMKQNQYTIGELEAYQESQFDEALHPNQLQLPFRESIEFSNVEFTFPKETQPALRGISLRLRKGEKIGFIGSSGSGKTTLMNLLLRFYTEQEGNIRVDGQPITPQHLQAWHQIVGYVKQDTFLMEASIKDNITLMDEEVDELRLAYALEQASLQTFVNSLPEGLNTFIGERGSKLSGGQRQRLGIARALYKRTEVLVLDEATSALDNQTEREVNEAINKLSSTDITILIIAHRITTLRECNRIYELDKGQVVGEYQYSDLIQQIV